MWQQTLIYNVNDTSLSVLLEHWKLSGTTGGETFHTHLSGGAGAAFAGIYLHGLKALSFHLSFVVFFSSELLQILISIQDSCH